MARILVVDDEPAIRELVGALLEDEGHEVRFAGDGREALDELEQDLPDLIVLDLAMPRMDGWRFLEELYGRGLRRRIRVVIVSGNLDDDAVGRGKEQEVSHFLRKPFDVGALMTMVTDALRHEPDELAVRRDRSENLARLIGKVDRVLG